MAWRTRHGKAARGSKAGPIWEDVPDGVRPVPDGAAEPIRRRGDGTFTSEGARAAVRRRQELERQPDFGDRTQPWMPPSPELEPFDGARRDLLGQRRDEIATITGGIDSGVGAQLRAWAYIHAAGEYWASKFFSTGDPEAFERMVRAFKAASTEDAKLRDAAAWAAAARPQQQNRMAELAERSRQRRAQLAAPAPAATETTRASSQSETRSERPPGPGKGTSDV